MVHYFPIRIYFTQIRFEFVWALQVCGEYIRKSCWMTASVYPSSHLPIFNSFRLQRCTEFTGVVIATGKLKPAQQPDREPSDAKRLSLSVFLLYMIPAAATAPWLCLSSSFRPQHLRDGPLSQPHLHLLVG